MSPDDSVEKIVDADIVAFNEWCVSERELEPVSQFERAILKTYLAWKLGIAKPLVK